MGGESGGVMTPPAADPTPGFDGAPYAKTVGEEFALVSVSGTNFDYTKEGVKFHYKSADGNQTSTTTAVNTQPTSAEATLSGLSAGTNYTVYATCTATDGTEVKSSEGTFTTQEPIVKPALDLSWLEIPAEMNGEEMGGVTTSDLFTHTFYYSTESEANRNFTVCYDKGKLTTYWVAYPLSSSHIGSVDRTNTWSYVSSSLLSERYQPNIVDGSYRSANNKNNYSRGHLLPSASRTNSTLMNQQTFMSVNLVPQIQNGFNGGVWMYLESALRDVLNGKTLYVVTGTALQRGDGQAEEIGTMEKTYDRSGKEISVPRYFYKVILKVNSAENPTSASAIGFWFCNKSYSGSYESFAVSVDEIESKLGMDFFPNLTNSLENAAEKNSSWNTFKSF